METIKTSKIKTLTYLREFTGNYGTMFIFNAVMENGEYGELTTKDVNKYKVGSEITYELTSKEFNSKVTWQIKVQAPQKPAYGGGFGGSKNESPDKANQIARMAAIKAVTDLIVADKMPLSNLIFEADKLVNYILNGRL